MTYTLYGRLEGTDRFKLVRDYAEIAEARDDAQHALADFAATIVEDEHGETVGLYRRGYMSQREKFAQ